MGVGTDFFHLYNASGNGQLLVCALMPGKIGCGQLLKRTVTQGNNNIKHMTKMSIKPCEHLESGCNLQIQNHKVAALQTLMSF